VVVSVVDRGTGIPEDLRAKVFERFFQIEPGSTGPRGGTGIGLSIVQRYVEHLNGRVWIEETEGGGSTFSFTLPRV